MKTKIITTLMLLITQVLISHTTQAQCHIDDWKALKALYESTDGDNWDNRRGWDEMIDGLDSPPENCDLGVLHGVWNSIDESGRVDELILDVNKLKGVIPPEIKGLKHLTYLSLDINELEGPIPPEIGHLTNLVKLEIFENKLTGSLPIELGELTELKYLYLSNNLLSGELPSELSSMSKLTNIDLSNNKLEGDIPIEFSKFYYLKSLNLKNNLLTGKPPAQMGYLKKLVSLNISNNQLSGCYPNNLKSLCQQLTHYAFTGNSFDSDWDEFCDNNVGACFELCNLNYWHILKSLYENTDGDNWKHRAGWDLYFDNQDKPPTDCNLYNLFGVRFDNEGKLISIQLGRNALQGEIPLSLSNLVDLEELVLEENNLSKTIPPKLFSLAKLTHLDLSHNEFVGPLMFEVDSISNLEFIDLGSNKIDGRLDSNIEKLNKLKFLFLYFNELSGQIPNSIFNLKELIYLDLYNNRLTGSFYIKEGSLPNLINLNLARNQLSGDIQIGNGSLANLKTLNLSYNEFNGLIPKIVADLELREIDVRNNKFSGVVPEFSSTILERLRIANNYFSCSDIEVNFSKHQQIENFIYSPQHYTPVNYQNNYQNILDLASIDTIRNTTTFIDTTIMLSGQFYEDIPNLIYQWKRNGDTIPSANQATLIIENVQPQNAGKYTLHISSDSCLPDDKVYEAISEPFYVILKGYDLYGQPVQYDQLMVEFDDAANTALYEQDILLPNGGYIANACNCNRELYLWQFPTTEAAAKALLSIDKKLQKIKSKPIADGGLNNIISFGKNIETQVAYQLMSDKFSENFQDEVIVFILDTGLDEQNFDASPYLQIDAPIDDCYEIDNSSGYSYEETFISNTYLDDSGHGTFGFRAITENLKTNGKMKVVPLKIFNQDGEGTLFNMTCALYHAIDHDADIINISAGYQGEPSDIFEKAIRTAQKKGIFITAAAGNDTLNIDDQPYYPAAFAGKYYTFQSIDDGGNSILDSLKYDHLISVASINAQDKLSSFSNYGNKSVTLVAYGENLHSKALQGIDAVASGTSMATFYTTKALAVELASDNTRNYQQVWSDFKKHWLVNNTSTQGNTQTGKQINFNLIIANIAGCTDPNNCNYFPYATINDNTCYPAFINHMDVIGNSSGFYQATDTIISNKVVKTSDSLYYIAGDLIHFKVGFSVKLGAIFQANIESCE